MTKYLITPKSGNAKVGKIMVTTSERKTCPDACPFKSNGCYADGGPLRGLWDKLSIADGDTITNGRNKVKVHGHDALCKAIESQPDGALWRHNQAGDLPGDADNIDVLDLIDIVLANQGKRGFTYTHKPVLEHQYSTKAFLEQKEYVKVTDNTVHNTVAHANRKAINMANRQGFTINLSGNNLEHADQLADLDIGPVVTVLPIDAPEHSETPKGRKVVVCPVVTGKAKDCASCQLCQRRDRKVIVGFPAHGAGKKKANAVASE